MAQDLIPRNTGFFRKPGTDVAVRRNTEITVRQNGEIEWDSGDTIPARRFPPDGRGNQSLEERVNWALGVQNRPPIQRIIKHCTVHLKAVIILTERYGTELRLFGSETSIPHHLSNDISSVEEMGEFSFEWSRYQGCPLCGAGLYDDSPFWWSSWCQCKGQFMCNGSMLSGHRTCKCGVIHGHKFTKQKTAAVTGLLPGIGKLWR